MLLSSALLNSVYAHSCFEAIVSGKTDPPLTLEAFRAYLRNSGAGEAELLQFWEWYRAYEERFSSLPPMVRSRARHPLTCVWSYTPHVQSARQPNRTPTSVASSVSPILDAQYLEHGESSSSTGRHAMPSSIIIGTPAVPATSTISCMNSAMYDKREGVEILPSILETAPLTFDDDLDGLGITSDTDKQSSNIWIHSSHTNHHSASKDRTEVSIHDGDGDYDHDDGDVVDDEDDVSTTNPTAAVAMHVVATAGDIPTGIPLQSVDSQRSTVTDTSSIEYPSTRVRLDTGPFNHSGRPGKPRKPPLQQEFNFALKRWFCTSSNGKEESVLSNCHTTIVQWRTRLVEATLSEVKEQPATTAAATATIDSAQISKELDTSIHRHHHHHTYTCNLPLPNTPAIRLALDELCQMAHYTTHPDLFLPLAIEAKNRLADYHIPRFVACLVRNVSHRTANIRMFIAAAGCLIGVVGVFTCLLFHAKRYLRIIPLLIIVYAISSATFSHFGLCLYRVYRQRKRDVNSSRLQELTPQQSEEGQQQQQQQQQHNRRRSSLASTGQPVSSTITTSQGYSRYYNDSSSLPYDTHVHGVYNTRKRICFRLIAFTFLLAGILGSTIMLVPDIPLYN
ncbi:hypothetical protein BDF22DRAFT_773591 [Syncephalis plumigaleata]|nr:hypothetical protein BDF22DRAFT_773591 [Syncephalis plumigaleata]